MSKKIRIIEDARMDCRAGIETFLIDLFRNMDKEKFQIDFLRTNRNEGPFDAEIRKNGGNIYYIRPISWNPISLYNHFSDLIDFLRQNDDIKVFHSHGNTALSLINCFFAKKLRVPIVIGHSHNNSVGVLRTRIIHYCLRSILRKSFDLRFACSWQAWDWMFPNADKSTGRIIKNGINVDRFRYSEAKRDEMRARLDIQNDFVLGCVGRLTQQKNQLFLLDLLPIILQRIPNAKLLLVGDGEMRDEIESICKKKKISDKVQITGFVNNVSDYLQALDLFLLPSVWEGLGICLIEAQTAGLPCVVSDAIAPEAIVTENVYKLPLANNETQWVNTINEIAVSYSRQDQTDLIRSHGYDLKSSVNEIANLYKM